jgi:hypothetical protein
LSANIVKPDGSYDLGAIQSNLPRAPSNKQARDLQALGLKLFDRTAGDALGPTDYQAQALSATMAADRAKLDAWSIDGPDDDPFPSNLWPSFRTDFVQAFIDANASYEGNVAQSTNIQALSDDLMVEPAVEKTAQAAKDIYVAAKDEAGKIADDLKLAGLAVLAVGGVVLYFVLKGR